MENILDIKWAYQLLQADHAASPDSIKKQYRTLVKQWHPDKWARYPEKKRQAVRKMQQINDAYNMIREAPLQHHTSRPRPQPKTAPRQNRTNGDFSRTYTQQANYTSYKAQSPHKSTLIGGILRRALWFSAGYFLGKILAYIFIAYFFKSSPSEFPMVVLGIEILFGTLSMIGRGSFWASLIEIITYAWI